MQTRPIPQWSLRNGGIGKQASAFRAEKFADGTDTPISDVEFTQHSLWGKVAMPTAIFAPTTVAVVSHKRSLRSLWPTRLRSCEDVGSHSEAGGSVRVNRTFSNFGRVKYGRHFSMRPPCCCAVKFLCRRVPASSFSMSKRKADVEPAFLRREVRRLREPPATSA